MYRLLIVDDEPSIVEGLYDLFENERQLNLDIYKAYSAKKAIEWLNRAKIDIVLTDIQMPGMNGLQLLEEIYSKWPQCKVIFLTAHSEFDYVYRAMQYNAVNYVLKTEGDQAILKAVEKCIDEINRSISTAEFVHKAEERMRLTMPLLQKEYLMNLLLGERSSYQERKDQFEKLCLSLEANLPVLLLAGRIDHYPPIITSLEKIQYLSGIDAVSQNYLGNLTNIVYLTWDRGKLLWFIQPNPTTRNKYINDDILWENTILFVKGNVETVQEVCKRSLDISVSFVIDNKPSSWDDITERFYFLKHIINYQIGNRTEMVFIDSNFFHYESRPSTGSTAHISKTQLYYNVKLDLLQTYLESGQSEEFFKLLTEVVELILIRGDNSGYFGLEVYHSLTLMLLSHINRWNLGDIIESQINIANLMGTTELISREETFAYFYKLGEIIFSHQKNEQKNRIDFLIFNIHQYVNEHLSEDLSLVALSEIVHLNPVYLSRIYKQTTGINLSDYITNMRISRAKKMLQQSLLKVHEIAAAVGYESAAYFTRVFKQSTLLTPQEYRAHCSKISSEKTKDVE